MFCLHVYLHACIVLRKPDVRSPGTGATDRCKPLCSCWGSNLYGRVASECFYPLSHLDPETHLMNTVVAPHNNLQCSRKMLLWTDVVFGSHVERSSVSQLPICRNLHCLLLISQCHSYVLRLLSELSFLFLVRVSPQTHSQKTFLVHVHLILLTLHPSFMSWHGRHFKVYVRVQVLWKRKNKQLREKGPYLDSWSWGRKLFQRAGSSYSFSTKHYFIIPTLRAWSSWCRAVREMFILGKHYHLFLLTFSRPGHQLLKLGEKLRCEQEMPIHSEIGFVSQLFESSKSMWLFSKGEEAKGRQCVIINIWISAAHSMYLSSSFLLKLLLLGSNIHIVMMFLEVFNSQL